MAENNEGGEHPRTPNVKSWGVGSAGAPKGTSYRGRNRVGKNSGRGRQQHQGGRGHELTVETPAPMHLSKTTSDLQTDPLYLEANFPLPSDELREISKKSSLTPGADGFMALAKQTYDHICSRSSHYKRTIPESAHTYFLGMTLIYRFLKLHSLNQYPLDYDEAMFVDQFEKGDYKVPAIFAKYLAGLGNTQLPSGVKQWFRYNKPTLLASGKFVPGFFGKISENPGLYASYPSSGVLVTRIQADVKYTKASPRTRTDEWDLPEPFADKDHPINENCIGYSRAVLLSNEQLQFINNKGIGSDDVGSSNNVVVFNITLMNGVAAHLTEVHGLRLEAISQMSQGSQGQLVTAEIQVPHSNAQRHAYRAFASHRIAGPVAQLGSAFLYRLNKDVDPRVLRHITPTTFSPTEEIPDLYIASLRSNMDGDPKLVLYDYESTDYFSHLALEPYVKADMNV